MLESSSLLEQVKIQGSVKALELHNSEAKISKKRFLLNCMIQSKVKALFIVHDEFHHKLFPCKTPGGNVREKTQ